MITREPVVVVAATLLLVVLVDNNGAVAVLLLLLLSCTASQYKHPPTQPCNYVLLRAEALPQSVSAITFSLWGVLGSCLHDGQQTGTTQELSGSLAKAQQNISYSRRHNK
jgi:hypothetical protein